MAASDIKEGVMRTILERNRREAEQEFQKFCEELLSLPADFELMPKGNFVADIELQPWRWLSLGVDLLQSRRVTAHVELPNGIQRPPMSSYLPYPVFQMATEIFLKGVWLCQYAECRALNDSSYVDPAARDKFQGKLSKGLGHDLLQIIRALQNIPEYQADASTMRFLDLVERIIRRFYYPPYKADEDSRWANSRYPKRVYDDNAQHAHAENLQSYPRAEWFETLFKNMERALDRFWRYSELITSSKSSSSSETFSSSA
jgi:hypothetical protein